jgi:hypothetical protein
MGAGGSRNSAICGGSWVTTYLFVPRTSFNLACFCRIVEMVSRIKRTPLSRLRRATSISVSSRFELAMTASVSSASNDNLPPCLSHASRISESATTGDRGPLPTRRTGMPRPAHLCAVRTPQRRWDAISFHPVSSMARQILS